MTTQIVTMEGTSSETRNLHAWSDKRHLYTKQRKRKEGNPLHPSIEAALTKLIQGSPNVKEMDFNDAWKTVNSTLFLSHPSLMQYFMPDEEQISKFLGIPLPEPDPVEEAKEDANEERFVGMRKIKLASPASSQISEEESDVIVFTKDDKDD